MRHARLVSRHVQRLEPTRRTPQVSGGQKGPRSVLRQIRISICFILDHRPHRMKCIFQSEVVTVSTGSFSDLANMSYMFLSWLPK